MIDERSSTGLAVVIGAGTMGGGIAAQLANAGWQVKLLDVADVAASDPAARSAIAAAGLKRMSDARPPLLFLPEFGERIEIGNTTDHLEWLRDSDWVVEAVAERMDVKQEMLAKVEEHAGRHTVVTSNTSGLGLAAMSNNLSSAFRARFLGSHFLNPPRYLKLLEVVPLAETDPEVSRGFVGFGEQILGHRVVIARDTPGFISTRIWIEHLMATVRIALEHGLTVEEADYLTGALLGRPRSATFRMCDIVGLDIVAAIAGNQRAALLEDPFRDQLEIPLPLSALIASGRLGDKSGGGFYRKDGREILALDLETLSYRTRIEPKRAEVDALQKLPLAERLAAIANVRDRPWADFVNAVLDSLNAYVEYAAPLIAPDNVSVDNVMRWGFQWELGPFAIDEARRAEPRMPEDPRGGSAPGGVAVTKHGRSASFGDPPRDPYVTIADLTAAGRTLFAEPAGTLVDMGDGVACLAFRTKMNTFSPELSDLLERGVKRAEGEFAALVLGSDAAHFSAGYNLKLLLDAAVAGDTMALDRMLRQVQNAFLGLKYAAVPVVAAVRGYTLGAGCECALHCAAVQAAAEVTIGLPELGVGLTPGGGGIKELLVRAQAGRLSGSDTSAGSEVSEPVESSSGSGAPDAIEQAFRIIVLDAGSPNAYAARRAGWLGGSDAISRNGDRLLHDAKLRALSLADGYLPPETPVIAPPREGAAEQIDGMIRESLSSGRFSDYDASIARKVAEILTPDNSKSRSEEDILAEERRALISLAVQPNSIARMKALLETGKPLRN